MTQTYPKVSYVQKRDGRTIHYILRGDEVETNKQNEMKRK